MDLELDGTGFGLGTRSQRYAAVIEDGVVSVLGGPAVVCRWQLQQCLEARMFCVSQWALLGVWGIMAL